ncbi:MAG: 4Fe-4S binding protein [Candidatus Omnitrophica bacterium]|nr:4Fe-4S binding protein [Candidatus Omnitrophota bacterium]
MAKIKIDKEKCKGCMLCLSVCSNGLIVRSKKLNKRGIHCVEFKEKNKKCTGCAMCAIICPDVCIEVWR